MTHEKSFSVVLRWVAVCFLFMTAFLIRLYNIKQPLLEFHATRQYHCALFARDFYYQTIDTVNESKKISSNLYRKHALKEPPLTELLVSQAYRLVGGEHLWIARILCIIFWLAGGIFLLLIARKLHACSVWLCLTFYLFAPFGILMSRSFMPESLMLMMFMLSILTIIWYYEKPSISRVTIAAFICGITVLIKLISIFPILGVFLAPGLLKEGPVKFAKKPANFLFCLIVFALGCVYYIHMIFFSSLKPHAVAIWSPNMLFTAFFWIGWLEQIGKIAGIIPFIVSAAAFLIVRNTFFKTLLAGWVGGYIVYALIFTYTTATHDHYHITLFPAVALAMGASGPVIKNLLARSYVHRRWVIVICGIIIFLILVPLAIIAVKASHLDYEQADLRTQKNLISLGLIVGVHQNLIKFLAPQFEGIVKTLREIGEMVNHSTKTITLGDYYGRPLQYYGELYGTNWPTYTDFESADIRGEGKVIFSDVREFCNRLEFQPEYFIITDIKELALQPDLKKYLDTNFLLMNKTSDYLIYDMRKTAIPDQNDTRRRY